ncbi:MAG: indole-3-glycerol phosphate synthase TrpC [Phycisphaerales bacterium]
MSDLLAEMAASSRVRAQALRASASLGQLRERALAAPAPKPLRSTGFCLIAEVKRASPSEGAISTDTDALAFVVAQAGKYAAGGASAISVLTEPSRFGGDISHAAAAAKTVGVPVMRKDFLVDPAQVYEARIHGCSGVLLILRMLTDQQLTSMLVAAAQCGLFILVEAFDATDLARASRVLSDLPAAIASLSRPGEKITPPHVLMGLNTRDLVTLKVNPTALGDLSLRFPPGYPRIAESGIATPLDVADVVPLGYEGALVGTALIRSSDPARLIADMLVAAKGSRSPEPPIVKEGLP